MQEYSVFLKSIKPFTKFNKFSPVNWDIANIIEGG
jgi:hypothetical protein